MNQRRNFVLVNVVLALVFSTISWGQEELNYELARKSLAGKEATIKRVEGSEAFQIDLFDSLLLCDSLRDLRDLEGPKHLLIGNSFANLHFDNFADELAQCSDIKAVVLDSVDFEPEQLDALKIKMPDTHFILSERTAVRCIDSSYRFAMSGRKTSSFFRFPSSQYDNPTGFDKELFDMAEHFIGRELIEGGWRQPLSREPVRFFRHLRNLNRVCLSGIPIVDDDLANLAQATEIEFLNLDESRINGNGLNLIGSKSIKTLVLTNIPTLETIPFKNFPKLESLLVSQSGISIESLKKISRCENLTRLEMAGIKCSTLDLQEILNAHPKLEKLTICIEDIQAQDPTFEKLKLKFPDANISIAPQGFSRQEHGWSKTRGEEP